MNLISWSVITWTPSLFAHFPTPSLPMCQSFPRAQATMFPAGDILASQMGSNPQAKDLILFLALQSQKLMTPSLPAVINQFQQAGLKLDELTGYSTTLPLSSCLFDLKVMIGIILYPWADFFKSEILARPSTVARPIVSAFLSRDIDCSCENLPKSTESMILLFPLVTVAISITKIFSLAVDPAKVPLLQSEVKTLACTSTERTGFGPPCQKFTLFSQAVEMRTFCSGMQFSDDIGALCCPTSATFIVEVSTALIFPSMQPTYIIELSEFQAQFVGATFRLAIAF